MSPVFHPWAQYLSILSPYLNLYSNFQIIFSRWVLSVAVSSLSRQQFSLLSTPPTAPHLDPTGGRCKPLQSPGQNVPTTKVMRVESDTFCEPFIQKILKTILPQLIMYRHLRTLIIREDGLSILLDLLNEWVAECVASNLHDFLQQLILSCAS